MSSGSNEGTRVPLDSCSPTVWEALGVSEVHLMLTKQGAWCRLDRLRDVVPHQERANTACFLETVIEYVTSLKNKVAVLEAQLQAAGAQPAGEMVTSATVVQAPATEVIGEVC